jgi:D-cysteine desulfhydrase
MKQLPPTGFYPSRLELAQTPTRLEFLRRISKDLGVSFYVKRDDLTGIELSGNKIRKLEFVLADAVEKKADVVLTCGGEQSNHARATAIAAARLNLKCCLILRTSNPDRPPAFEGNSLLDALVGSEIVWVSPEEYHNRDAVFKREAARFTTTGLRPYVIPEGASNALGAWGYIRAAEELKNDMESLFEDPDKSTTIVVAVGSGGTYAGLLLGAKLHGLNARIVGFNVCDDRAHFINVIGNICDQAISKYELPIQIDHDRDIEIIDGYVGHGYARSQPEELECLQNLAQKEGIILDPVYTGKTFYGLVSELKKDRYLFGKRIVFVHSGGLFGLFAFKGMLNTLLAPSF